MPRILAFADPVGPLRALSIHLAESGYELDMYASRGGAVSSLAAGEAYDAALVDMQIEDARDSMEAFSARGMPVLAVLGAAVDPIALRRALDALLHVRPPAPAALAGKLLPYDQALEAVRESFEREYLRRLLAEARGNLTAASRKSGLSRRHLQRLRAKHGLTLAEFRTPRAPIAFAHTP